MITALDHIAIAVPDLEKAIARFVADFGLPLGGTEDVEEAKTTAAFLPLPPTKIELVDDTFGKNVDLPGRQFGHVRGADIVSAGINQQHRHAGSLHGHGNVARDLVRAHDQQSLRILA